VRDQHAVEPTAVVAAGIELLACGAGRLVGGAREPRLSVDMGRDIGTEACVDQKVALGMGHQDRRCGEGAFVAE